MRRLLLDLDPCGGTDPLGMFPLFLKRTADVMALLLSVVFQRLVRLGSFPACWRQANVTPIPKGPLTSSVANYRSISITSVFSKVFERQVSVRLGRFMERSGVLPTTQLAYRKGLGTCDALLSALRVLEVLSCLYQHSFYQTDHSKLWWMVVGVNWLMLYPESRRAVFWARYCSFCTLQAFFHFRK